MVDLTLAIAIAWLVWAFLARSIMDNPRGTLEAGLLMLLIRVYTRLVHRLRVEGGEHIPRQRHPGPLVVVVNHSAGVDPLLVQAACPFEIRWMMAEDMRLPSLNWLWGWLGVIFVHRARPDFAGTREAIRHLLAGGVLGVFPEGGLERPPQQILPFMPGVGGIIRRTGAPVLPVVVSGTPQVDPAWASLWCPSRARVRFGPIVDFRGRQMTAEQITAELRQLFLTMTGWAANDNPHPGIAPARDRARASA